MSRVEVIFSFPFLFFSFLSFPFLSSFFPSPSFPSESEVHERGVSICIVLYSTVQLIGSPPSTIIVVQYGQTSLLTMYLFLEIRYRYSEGYRYKEVRFG